MHGLPTPPGFRGHALNTIERAALEILIDGLQKSPSQPMQTARKKYASWASKTLLALFLIGVAWYAVTPQHKGHSISPRHFYRLDFYDASPLQRLMHLEMKIPSFVRLYRIQPETLLGESDVVDLWINGQIYWYLNPPMNKVRVGRDVVFENIPPECTDCPPLPDSAVMP